MSGKASLLVHTRFFPPFLKVPFWELVLNHVSQLLICINASTGFILYLAMSKEFRRQVSSFRRSFLVAASNNGNINRKSNNKGNVASAAVVELKAA